ncbi:MAG: hypothetical protein JW772_01485, partial [Candidatus Diapherotrites archaeon]|nr:hypothetical protein [Candidatus Diapherotrites archaeon]
MKTSGKKGFVISMDTFFAITIFLGILAYAGLGLNTQSNPIYAGAQTEAKIAIDEAVLAMASTGFIQKTMVDDYKCCQDIQAETIHTKLEELLPANMDSSISITIYKPKDPLPNQCKTKKTMGICFEDTPTTISFGKTAPTDREILYGNQLFVAREPVHWGTDKTCYVIEVAGRALQEKESGEKISLQGSPIITTKTNVVDQLGNPFDAGNNLECYDPVDGVAENEIATVTIAEKSGVRAPVAVMSVTDRSGSMSTLDMPFKTGAGQISFNEGLCEATGNACWRLPDNCYDFTDWVENVATFDLNQEVLDLMSDSDYLLFMNLHYSGSGYQCSRPRIGLTDPNSVDWYYNSSHSTSSAWYYAYIYKPNLMLGSYNVKLWADVPTRIQKPMHVRLTKAYRETPNLDITGKPSEEGCGPVAEGDWTTIKTFDVGQGTIIPGYNTIPSRLLVASFSTVDVEGSC